MKKTLKNGNTSHVYRLEKLILWEKLFFEKQFIGLMQFQQNFPLHSPNRNRRKKIQKFMWNHRRPWTTKEIFRGKQTNKKHPPPILEGFLAQISSERNWTCPLLIRTPFGILFTLTAFRDDWIFMHCVD